MGSGIAQKSAQEEFDVQMVDREQQWVDRGQSIIANFLEEAVERRIFPLRKWLRFKGASPALSVLKTPQKTPTW